MFRYTFKGLVFKRAEIYEDQTGLTISPASAKRDRLDIAISLDNKLSNLTYSSHYARHWLR